MYKKLGIVVSSLALAVFFGVAPATATPHIDESGAIADQPDAPKPSDKCGQEGLEPVLPETKGKPWSYSVHKNEVTVTLNDPNAKFASYVQTYWIVPVKYTPCEDAVDTVDPVDPVGSVNPNFLIVEPPQAPCVLPNGVADLPLATDKYTYGYTPTSVLATAKPGFEFQQETTHEWPLADIVTPCPVVEAPVVTQPEPAKVTPVPASAPVAAQPESAPVAAKPQTSTLSDNGTTPTSVPLANVGVSAEANLPDTLANTPAVATPQVNPNAVWGIFWLFVSAAAALLGKRYWFPSAIKK